jgi:hypothetical protein
MHVFFKLQSGVQCCNHFWGLETLSETGISIFYTGFSKRRAGYVISCSGFSKLLPEAFKPPHIDF